MIKFKPVFLVLFVVLFSASLSAQQKHEDEKKEVDEFAKKKPTTKLTEVIATDSLPASELHKRAVHWIKEESNKYKKTGGTSSGSKAECIASFPVKPKDLNPQADYTGKITMKVVIESKDNKYKYTVSDITHISKSGNLTAGSIDNVVPECGSQILHDVVWKKLKGEALRCAAQVVVDLKEGMLKHSDQHNKEEW